MECKVESCHQKVICKGFCATHYERDRLGRPIESPIRGRDYELRDDGTKYCGGCRAYKLAVDFGRDVSKPDALASRCRQCHVPQRREQGLWSRYGITGEAYDRLLADQHGKCALCRRAESTPSGKTGNLRPLSVDHNHRTGKIRGLLCHKCNIVLGLIDEDLNLAQEIISYLRKEPKNATT